MSATVMKFAVAGAHAASIGRARDSNPHPAGDGAFEEWDVGWVQWTASALAAAAVTAAHPSLPKFKAGQLMEILHDRVCERAPCTATIVGVRRRWIVIEHADLVDEMIQIKVLRDSKIEVTKTASGKVLYIVR